MKQGTYLATAWIITLLIAGLVFLSLPASSESTTGDPGDHLKSGAKYRIGYCEGEPFVNFAGTLNSVLRGLEEAGWIESLAGLPYEPGQEDSRVMWEWLAARDNGPYLEFVEDAHYSFFLEPGSEDLLIERLGSAGDLDLVIAMGTQAGISLAGDQHSVPVLVFSSSNPLLSGIVESNDYSGHRNLWAHTDPNRDRRLFEVFHDLFGFKKMGVVYEDSDLGRTYAAVDVLEEISVKQGFEIARRFVDGPAHSDDKTRYYNDLFAAHQELSLEVDAFLVAIASIEPSRLEEMLVPFYERGIPVFSQLGSEEVRFGAVASVSRADFTDVGRFGADAIMRVLSGEEPGAISQVFVATTRIALNMEAAERVGYRVPFEVLLVADHIYHEIER